MEIKKKEILVNESKEETQNFLNQLKIKFLSACLTDINEPLINL